MEKYNFKQTHEEIQKRLRYRMSRSALRRYKSYGMLQPSDTEYNPMLNREIPVYTESDIERFVSKYWKLQKMGKILRHKKCELGVDRTN